ncbi:hypothetical protein Tco_0046148 [Tanacetum coccineum]
MESSNSNSRERELQLTQLLIKQRHSHCMTWFEQLKIHLRDLYLNNSSYALRLQLKRENLHEVNAKTCLEVLRTQFKEFFASKGNLDTLEAVIHRAIITYGILRMKENEVNALKVNGKQLNEEILHEHEIKKSFKLQSQDVQINSVQAVDDSLIVSKSSWIELENNNALSKSVNETQLQHHESLITKSTTLEANLNTDIKALDAGSVITESSGTKSDKHDTSNNSGNYITHAMDVYIRRVNDQVPEVQLTAQHNVLANEQQHTEQSEPIYDMYLLKKVDSNTTLDSKNICHRGGEIDQDAEQYQTIEQTTSLIAKNDEFKAQLQEKGFTIATLKNKLRKLKGNSVDTKFAKPSILGKPVLQPPRNQSVVRQSNAFKSKRPNFSKPRFASQVDVNNVLSKPVTPHYLPKVQEYVLATPHHVIAPGSSRNSQEESYGSHNMAHNHYLEEVRKKDQERNMIKILV